MPSLNDLPDEIRGQSNATPLCRWLYRSGLPLPERREIATMVANADGYKLSAAHWGIALGGTHPDHVGEE